MTELKKCPHCGGEAKVYNKTIGDDSTDWFYVECENCAELFDTEAEAIAAWNKRAKEENSLTLDEIRAVLENYKNNAYCNSTSCKNFGNFVSCLECLMQEFEAKARG